MKTAEDILATARRPKTRLAPAKFHSTKVELSIVYSEGVTLEFIRLRVDIAGGQRAWCRKHGVSQSYLSAMLSGKKPVSDEIAAKCGYRKITGFVQSDLVYKGEVY